MIRKFLGQLRKDDNRRLISNFISLVSVKGFDLLIPLFILPYLVRTLGIDVFGLTQFSLAFVMYFGALIHYGYSITAVRDIARSRTNANTLSRVYSKYFSVAMVLLLLSSVMLVIILLLVPGLREDWLLHVYTFYFVAMQSLFPSWFFQGMEKMRYIAFINLSTRVMFLISLLLLVKNPEDYLLVPLLNAFAMTLSTLISFWLIHSVFKVKLVRSSISEMKGVIVVGRHAFISLFSPTLYTTTTTFLLGITTSNYVLGIYTSATKLIDALNSLGLLISNTFLPYLSRKISKHGGFSKIMLASGAILTLGAFFFADIIIEFMYGSDKMVISEYFMWLAPMVMFIFIRFTYGPNFLMLIGKEVVYKNIVLYSCILFFLIALAIVPLFDIYGAISIMLGTSLLMAILTFYFYRKNMGVLRK
ncbi:oligosaccharide flippase family protein [Aureitalea sp. L0-47]|uniref:oligosaccharide flippase family protein n=1 Tax=Aureitalea sp. L0-47 TaxID=2816962 RepID=UPI0022376117|nr:oligosaccharide flippase family protein [Aureitalea sp. L0-47]MCW5520393.1 oligosaccharide flippase family protein [Aureitalea sp. L0-47]